MCGLAGIVNLDGAPVDAALLVRLRDLLAHRGPDDAGAWHEGPVGLAHRRLSILDLSPLGHQPMVSADGQAWIVFNGEIFNYVELRDRLAAAGHRFRSTSDTEVLVELWRARGPACLDDLIGMFAFVIWDRERRTLFAARDRAGIKPLYFARTPRSFVFASEMKAVLAHPDVPARVDPRGFGQHVFAGYAFGERTVFDGVRQLPPGHLLELRDGELRVAPYWGVRYRYDRTRDHAATAAELATLLEDAVRLHCRSDAPVGGHLSGGLDSSTVVTLARSYRDPLDTFSIRFGDGDAYDESRYARAVATRVGTSHHEERPGASDLRRLLPFLVWHMDVPTSRSAFAYFTGARLARRHVTVSLTGHGGDEVFGGYPAQFRVGFGATGTPLSAAAPRRAEAGAVRRLLRLLRTEGVAGLLDRVRRRVQGGGGPVSPEEQWIALHCNRPEPARNPALARALRAELAGWSPVGEYLHDFAQAPTDELFDRCLHHDLRSYLPSLLHAEDRASMAVSLESRVPLLDHRLIEFAATVPPDVKSPARRSKELMRTVMRDRLPAELLERQDKGAFPVPIAEWFRGSLAEYAREILLDERTLDRGLYDADWLREAAGAEAGAWPALTAELWARLFLDRDPALLAEVEAARGTLELARPAAGSP